MYYLIAVYIVGYWLAFVMQRTEVAAAAEPYTMGDRLLIASTSLLSWVMVVIVLVTAWVKSLGAYWEVPVEKPTMPTPSITGPAVAPSLAPRRHTNAASN